MDCGPWARMSSEKFVEEVHSPRCKCVVLQHDHIVARNDKFDAVHREHEANHDESLQCSKVKTSRLSICRHPPWNFDVIRAPFSGSYHEVGCHVFLLVFLGFVSVSIFMAVYVFRQPFNFFCSKLYNYL